MHIRGKITTILVLATLQGAAFAGQFANSWGKITAIRSYGLADASTPPTYIQVAGTSVNSNCASADWGKGALNYWYISPDEKHLLSVILTAYSTGQNVKVTSNDDTSYKIGGACRVVYVDVQD